jgi:cyclopropane-fatty-acyl-phospholipid synthase
MNDSIVPHDRPNAAPRPAGWLDRRARDRTLARLDRLEDGELIVRDGEADRTFGKATEAFPVRATLTVHSPRFWSALALGGSLGAAESYIAGEWVCDDLADLVRILVRNRRLLEATEAGLARLAVPFARLYHWLRRNTRAGSRANIAAHYDLGNDFYALFLDETMTYSCAVFEQPEMTLAEAQTAKYDRLCRKLALSPRDHLLEIGTGWGGFALHAAEVYGCRVTTTTISREQAACARDRIEAAGLGDRVEVLEADYRDLTGRYDKLVSIEMIEAVGHQYLDAFFRTCAGLLHPDGLMALQAITITDQLYDRHVRTVDFIKRYVFPGSCLLSVTAMCGAATRASDLRAVHLEEITPHYARTLRTWRDRFLERADNVRAMGFPETFLRLWEYYLAYCEGAFAERYIGDVQMVFAKPLDRRPPILPPLPAVGS